MAATATVREGDTLTLTATLTGANGAPQGLEGATVRFSLRAAGATTPVVDREECDVLDAAAGRAQYVGDPALEPGLYYGEFEVTLADETVVTFPNVGYAEVTVTEAVA